MAHFDAATGGVTLATALKDGVIVATWDELLTFCWWFRSFSVTAVATAPTTTTAAVVIAAMVTAPAPAAAAAAEPASRRTRCRMSPACRCGAAAAAGPRRVPRGGCWPRSSQSGP